MSEWKASACILCECNCGIEVQPGGKDRLSSPLRTLDNEDGSRSGVAVNELTSLEACDRFAGTPHHRIVPARIEAMP